MNIKDNFNKIIYKEIFGDPSISLGKRDDTAEETHWQDLDTSIPGDEVCLVHFPGANARTPQDANGSIKILQSLPYSFDNYYGVYYQQTTNIDESFTTFRQETFAGTSFWLDEQVKSYFNAVITPRLAFQEDSRKLDIPETKRRLENMFFVAHCHGSAVFQSLLKYMKNKLAHTYNLSEEQQKDVMGSINAHVFAPACPLDWSGANVISFISLSDENAATISAPCFEFKDHYAGPEVDFLTWVRNNLCTITKQRDPEVALAHCAYYIPEHQMFVVGRKFSTDDPSAAINEHNNISYTYQFDTSRTPQGKEVIDIAIDMVKGRFTPFQQQEMRDSPKLRDWQKRGEDIWQLYQTHARASYPKVLTQQPLNKAKQPLPLYDQNKLAKGF